MQEDKQVFQKLPITFEPFKLNENEIDISHHFLHEKILIIFSLNVNNGWQQVNKL